jgi:hypothetical protein
MTMEFKMKTKGFVITSLSTLALLALPGVASASPFNSERGAVSQIEWRIDNQFRRIQNGRVDGSLTHREFRTLMRANRRLNRKLNRSLDDGFLSLFEEDRLFAMLGNQSSRIRRLKNNHRMARFTRHRRGFRSHRLRPNRVAYRF